MALGSLNLKVSQSDFETRVGLIEEKMSKLQDVIESYGRAKENLDQFIEGGDSTYDAMLERIDVNITAARKSYAALQATKVSLQETITQMEGMSGEVKNTIEDATGAVGSVINAAFKIEDVL